MSTCKVPISDLPEKKPLVGNESIPIVDIDTGLTKKSTLNELSSFVTLDYVTTGGNTTNNGIVAGNIAISGTSPNITLTEDSNTDFLELKITNSAAAFRVGNVVGDHSFEFLKSNINGSASDDVGLDASSGTLSLRGDAGITAYDNLTVVGDVSATQGLSANSGSFTTEILSAGVNINTLFGAGGGGGGSVGTLQQVTDLGNSTTNSINAASLSAQGVSTFNSEVQLLPPLGRAITARSTNTNNPGIQAVFEGPVTVGHDLFQKSGFTDGFADNSNHFHALIDINRIEQEAESDVKNIERVQERYYAVPNNHLANNQAAFWAWHQAARGIDTTTVNTDTATLDVSLLQNSTNRALSSQAFFASNTSPAGTSEPLIISKSSHGITTGANVQMEFSQSFPGPIVAANLFGKVTNSSTNSLSVVLYDGNYKSKQEVPLGTSQTALNFTENGESLVRLKTVGTATVILAGQENELAFYNKTNFSPERSKNEFITASFSTTGHNLVKNEHVTLITSGITTAGDDIPVKEEGYILDPDLDGDGLKVLIVLGRRIKQYDLGTFSTLVGSSNWTLHKGSTDGIHNDTLGDQFFNFNANNIGEVTSYQIGPGSQTDSPSAISIGKNVYNSEANTIKIGYDNEMLNITPTGLKTPGNITAVGSVSAASLSAVNGFTGTGNFTNFTIQDGIIINATT